jgi:hypothetical protein
MSSIVSCVGYRVHVAEEPIEVIDEYDEARADGRGMLNLSTPDEQHTIYVVRAHVVAIEKATA